MHSSAVRTKTFSTGPGGVLRIFGERFTADDVYAFLEQCAATLEAYESGVGSPPLRSDDVVVKQFQTTRFGHGFDPDEVDDYLDEVVAALRHHEAARVEDLRDAALAASPPLTADGVRSRTFSTRGMGAVEREPVHAFLVRCADALDAAELGGVPGLTPEEILAKRFPQAVVELGYDSDEVDEFLGDVAATLAVHARER